MKQAHKTFAFWLFIMQLCLLLVAVVKGQGMQRPQRLPWSDFVTKVETAEVARITVSGDEEIAGDLKNGERFVTRGPIKSEGWEDKLASAGIKVDYVEARDRKWGTTLVQWVPAVIILLIVFFFMRQLQVGGGKAIQFGKSKARLISDGQKRVTFTDAAGVDEAI